ncbi:MAG: hypothetical protein KKH44_10555, partial [Bacteroidetes bacterium]|nr:hypothetical protein [Bacteroidota bacterium]
QMSEIFYKLAGVPITLTDVRWTLKAGVHHNETAIVVPDKIADKIWTKRNNMRERLLTLEFNNKSTRIAINNLCLILKKRTSKIKALAKKKEGFSSLHIADLRWFWQHIKWFGRYNLLKTVNDRDMIKGIPKIALDHFTYNVKSYKRYSIRHIKVTKKGKKLIETEEYRPWNVVELADLIMKTIEPDNYLGIYDYNKKLLKLTPNNLDYAGMPVQNALSNLLHFARGNIGITNSGKFYIYPIEDNKLQEKVWNNLEKYSVNGNIYKTNWAQYRPRELNVYFKKEQEVLFDYWETGKYKTIKQFYDIKDKEARNKVTGPYIENVAIIPRNMEIDGIQFEAGEYVPISRLCTEWGIPESKLRFRFFTDTLMRWYMGTVHGIPQKLWGAYPEYIERITTLQQHYRKTFKVHPAWQDQVLSVRAVTSDIADYVVGNRVPSFINTQWCKVMRLKGAASSITPSEKAGINIDGAPIGVPADIILANPKKYPAAPIQFVPSNAELGIYKMSVYQDKQHQTKTVTPSKLDNLPTTFMEQGGSNWSLVNLNDDFRFIARLSVMFGTPNTDEQYLKVTKTFKNQSYPRYDIFCHKPVARYNWKKELVNKESVQAMADAQLEVIKYELRDRFVGTVTLAGLHIIQLYGTIDEISFLFGADGSAKTTVNCPIKPPKRDVYDILAPELRRLIYGEPDPEKLRSS